MSIKLEKVMNKELLKHLDKMITHYTVCKFNKRPMLVIEKDMDAICALADELRGKEWQPIKDAKMPKEYKDDEYFLTRIEHWYTKGVKYVVGRMEEDGFYFNDRDELSMDWNPTHWMPLPQPLKEK